MSDNKTIYTNFAKAVSVILGEAQHMKEFYGKKGSYLNEETIMGYSDCEMFSNEGTNRFTDTLDYYLPILKDLIENCNGFIPPSVPKLLQVLKDIHVDAQKASDLIDLDIYKAAMANGTPPLEEYKALQRIINHVEQWQDILCGYYGVTATDEQDGGDDSKESQWKIADDKKSSSKRYYKRRPKVGSSKHRYNSKNTGVSIQR